MAKKYLDDTGMSYFWGKLKAYFQPTLVSGTNIKTINNETLLGSGNISVGVIKQASITGTTDSNGNLQVNIGVPVKVILFAWDNTNIFIPFYFNGQWYMRVQQTNAAGTARVSALVSCNVYYIEG